MQYIYCKSSLLSFFIIITNIDLVLKGFPVKLGEIFFGFLLLLIGLFFLDGKGKTW